MVKEQARGIPDKRPWFNWIFDTQSTEELKNKYDSWASNYDADLKEDWYFMPNYIAKKVSKLLPNKNSAILDAGAGTGFVGEALTQEGYRNLTAVDLSEKMLAIAKEKQVYKTLHQSNLEDNSIFSDSANFDAVIAAGVFTFAHTGVKTLLNLFTLLKEEGFFLLTIREDYRQQMQSALEQLPWTLIIEENFPIYDEAKTMYLLGFQKEKKS